MDWSGILGIVIALGITSLVYWGAQILMGFLEHPKTQPEADLTRHTTRPSASEQIADRFVPISRKREVEQFDHPGAGQK